MNKRGSHVGIIASFTIFIFFLVGMYFVIEPVLKVQKDKESLLSYVEKDLIEEFSGNLTIVVVNSSGLNCIQVNNSDASVNTPIYAIAKDKNNSIKNSTFSGDRLIINSSNQPVLWIYYSSVPFLNGSTSVSGCSFPNIESIRSNKEIFEIKISNAVSNITTLKQKLDLPEGSDFDFSFEANNGSIISTGIQDIKEDVYAEEFRIQYIDQKANSLAGKIKIRVW